MSNYVPRLTMGNIYNSPYYTFRNAYWYEYRMPNCTAYSFGRFNELANEQSLNYKWPTGNGCDWFIQAPAKGLQTGQVPQLGAAACWWYVDSQGNPSGHCGVVEEITYNALKQPVSFRTSNSAYYRSDPSDPMSDAGEPIDGFPYFYLESVYMDNLDYRAGHPEAYFQGFVYHPNIQPPAPAGDITAILGSLGIKRQKIKYIRRWKLWP